MTRAAARGVAASVMAAAVAGAVAVASVTPDAWPPPASMDATDRAGRVTNAARRITVVVFAPRDAFGALAILVDAVVRAHADAQEADWLDRKLYAWARARETTDISLDSDDSTTRERSIPDVRGFLQSFFL